MSTTDPIAVLDNPEAIRQQLRETQAREKALRVLLRAAAARDRARRKPPTTESSQGAGHA